MKQGVFAETWIYDLARDVWTQGPDMLTPRHGLAAAAVDGVVYAIAGASGVGAGVVYSNRGPVGTDGAVTGLVEAFTLG